MVSELVLIVQEPSGAERVVPLADGEIRIGREETNDLVLDDPGASLRHAVIACEGGRVTVQDRAEGGPVILNGMPRKAGLMVPGDVLRIGGTRLALRRGADRLPGPGSEDVAAVERARLDLLAEIVNVLPRGENRGKFLRRVLTSLFRIMDLRRAFISLIGEESDEPVQVAAENREEDGSPVVVSHAILSRVLLTGQGLLCSNAMANPEFSDSESIVEEQIKSVVCAPIHRGEQVIGVLYGDNRSKPRSFTPDDLTFLSLIARILSVQLENLDLTHRLREENIRLTRILEGDEKLVGVSAEITQLLRTARKLAASRETILITGETGTGKSLLARTIHQMSPRAEEPFVEVSCAAIPDTLLEAEVFGYGPQSGISGANPKGRVGLFEAAGKGTIFLDEIGDLSPGLQGKVLQVLEHASFRRLGSNDTRKVRCRILAATNQDLEEAVRQGRFRKDLYFRIHVMPLVIPPLEDRIEDVIPITEHFLEVLAPGRRLRLGAEAREILLSHVWPGNVRELRNVIARALALGEGRSVSPDLLRGCLTETENSIPSAVLTLDQVQRRHMRQVLGLFRGNKKRAARALGISRSKLYAWLR